MINWYVTKCQLYGFEGNTALQCDLCFSCFLGQGQGRPDFIDDILDWAFSLLILLSLLFYVFLKSTSWINQICLNSYSSHCFLKTHLKILYDPGIPFLEYIQEKNCIYFISYNMYKNIHNNLAHNSLKLRINQKFMNSWMNMYIHLFAFYCLIFEYNVWQIVFSKDSWKKFLPFHMSALK